MTERLFTRSSFPRFVFPLIFLGLVQLQTGCGRKDDNTILLIPVSGALSGVVTYEDKEYDQDGFTGTTKNKPVRFAEVEAVNSLTGEVLASSSTDASGAYSLNYTFYAGYPVKLRVIASAGPSGTTVAEIKNYQGQVYAVSASVLSPTVNITIPVSNPAGGAFNTLDALTSGAEFVTSLAGAYPPQVAAHWEDDGSGPYGTAYCTGACIPGPGIFIIGNNGGDTDGYDDDVIWHEYGHFTAEKFSRDDSEGGYHALGQNDLDLRLAWSEGWGDFFQGAVKSWLSANDPARKSSTAATPDSYYVDTIGNTWQISFDFGAPPITDGYLYASSETGVAKVLWDLSEAFPMTSLWPIIDTYIPTVVLPTNLEAFWDGWYSLYNGDAAAMTSAKAILNGRSIYYEPDTFEPDDTIDTAKAMLLLDTHYLYKPIADDHDFVFFNALEQQYTITASNRKNGAYPLIMVFDSSKSPVATGQLSVTFTPAAAVLHYIEVKPSPTRPASAGRYGTYTLTITSP